MTTDPRPNSMQPPEEPGVRLTDLAFSSIEEVIAAAPPERGAALLGSGDLVTAVAHDDDGSYTSAAWDLSDQLGALVAGLERASVGQLRGTVHSHPAGLARPSATDIASNVEFLRRNPHLPSIVAMIVASGDARGPLQVPIGARQCLTAFRVRLVEGRPLVTPVRMEVVPLGAAVGSGGALVAGVTTREWARDPARALSKLPRSNSYRNRPSVFIPLPQDQTLVLPVEFPAERSVVVRPVNGALEENRQHPAAAATSWLSLTESLGAMDAAPTMLARVVPLIGDLGGSRVVVAGLGSIGSRIAEDLVRSGVGSLTLVDPDHVEQSNLARSVYSWADVGRPKADALSARLRDIRPEVEVSAVIEDLASIDLAALIKGADLVIGATDDLREQHRLAHHTYAAGIPMVCCAMYRQARAGEIVMAVPAADTACVACAQGTASTTRQPEPDYGLRGRLSSEPGLGPSIQVVASTASMLAIALLAGPDAATAPLITQSIAAGRTLGMIATYPRWDFFPDVIAGDGHQVAPQSVWMAVRREPDCVVCGSVETRVAPAGTPFAEGVLELLASPGRSGPGSSASTPQTKAPLDSGGRLRKVLRRLLERRVPAGPPAPDVATDHRSSRGDAPSERPADSSIVYERPVVDVEEATVVMAEEPDGTTSHR